VVDKTTAAIAALLASLMLKLNRPIYEEIGVLWSAIVFKTVLTADIYIIPHPLHF
jgi:hypothetical protein